MFQESASWKLVLRVKSLVSGGRKSWGRDQESCRVSESRDGPQALARNPETWLTVRKNLFEVLRADLELINAPDIKPGFILETKV